MRGILFFLAFAVGCESGFQKAQKADTIEAWEQYLDGPEVNQVDMMQAQERLGELLLEKARAEKSLETYDRWLARFPEGSARKDIIKEKEDLVYADAEAKNTPESWKVYLDMYPKASRKRKDEAARRVRMSKYNDKVEVGPVTAEQVNLAEDPNGPLNGWGFTADVTNKGDLPIQWLMIRIAYLDADGKVLDTDEYPAVARQLPGMMPMGDAVTTPMKPGETRKWAWTTGDMVEGWSRQATLTPVDIRWQGGEGDLDALDAATQAMGTPAIGG